MKRLTNGSYPKIFLIWASTLKDLLHKKFIYIYTYYVYIYTYYVYVYICTYIIHMYVLPTIFNVR